MRISSYLGTAHRLRRGFTLVELLAVMGIMALLLAVTIPSIEGLNMSAGLNQGGQLFSDQVALARQTAAARNITVEIRCIKMPKRSSVGYTALQLWSPSSAAPISRVTMLPDGMAISEDPGRISTIFGTYLSTGVMPVGTPAAGNTYVSFTINPSGMVGPLSNAGTPPNMTAIAVGIVAAGHATDTVLPKNYVLIQLNPLTASTVVYRP